MDSNESGCWVAASVILIALAFLFFLAVIGYAAIWGILKWQ